MKTIVERARASLMHIECFYAESEDDQKRVRSIADAISALSEDNERLKAEREWQPIETASKDGSKFDAWIPDAFGGHRMTDLSFNARGQLRQHGLLTAADLPRWPTHWRPLPDPPALQHEGGGREG